MKVFLKIILISSLLLHSVITYSADFSGANGINQQALESNPPGVVPLKASENKSFKEKEIKTFSSSVSQPFAGSQSPDEARIAAVAKGKAEALEKAGTYLETMSVVENFTLTKDQTIALASGILSVDILSQKNFATDEGFGMILEMKINVDTSVMNKRVRQIHEDEALMEKFIELKGRENELLEKIKKLENLNRELGKLPEKGKKDKRNQLKREYDEVIQAIPAGEWNQKAISLWERGKYKDPNKAIEYLNESIQLDSKNPVSFNNRGVAYYNLGNRQLAIGEFNQALKLDSNYADAYNNRGVVLFELRQYQKAIEDFNRVISLKPQRVDSFLNRAAAYKNIWQYQNCLDDLKQALLLDPNYARKNAGQGSANIDLNEIERLCENACKACNLGLCKSKNYLDERGFCK
ncbi:MAG: tetratricopeptide repeat protein [Desulfobacteraceae bacterium]|nr:MAG: tetratricopeptide repeat protein [Desulfobacteraceae bacterium]